MLLKYRDAIPLGTVRVKLRDPLYARQPQVFLTLIVKRKSIDLYKARLCYR